MLVDYYFYYNNTHYIKKPHPSLDEQFNFLLKITVYGSNICVVKVLQMLKD